MCYYYSSIICLTNKYRDTSEAMLSAEHFNKQYQSLGSYSKIQSLTLIVRDILLILSI